jgi:hypothetical protein
MIMVGSVAKLITVRLAGGGAPTMTMVTPRSGYDLEHYIDRTVGEKTAGGYYLNAAQQGEPPGRWFGKREATRDGAPPVELIDGDRLCDLLKEFRLGVEVRERIGPPPKLPGHTLSQRYCGDALPQSARP